MSEKYFVLVKINFYLENKQTHYQKSLKHIFNGKFWFWIVNPLHSFFVLLFNYSCPHFSPTTLPCPTHAPPTTLNLSPTNCCLCAWVPYTRFLMTLPRLSPVTCPSPPLWSLSVYSLFPCLWLYFAHLFCWSGSNYRWDHKVFFFHLLAYFT